MSSFGFNWSTDFAVFPTRIIIDARFFMLYLTSKVVAFASRTVRKARVGVEFLGSHLSFLLTGTCFASVLGFVIRDSIVACQPLFSGQEFRPVGSHEGALFEHVGSHVGPLDCATYFVR